MQAGHQNCTVIDWTDWERAFALDEIVFFELLA